MHFNGDHSDDSDGDDDHGYGDDSDNRGEGRDGDDRNVGGERDNRRRAMAATKMMAAVAKNAAIEINTINALTTVRAMTALTQRIRTVAVMSALFQNVPPRKSIVFFALFGSGVFGFGLPRALLSLKLSHSTLYSASASQTKSAQQVSEKKTRSLLHKFSPRTLSFISLKLSLVPYIAHALSN